MTDTLNKTQQSCTGYRTPETDTFFSRTDIDWDMEVEFARYLERERDEASNSCHIWHQNNINLIEERINLIEERDKYFKGMLDAEIERNTYENALIKIEKIAYMNNDVYHDIEHIEAIAHNALVKH